MCGIVGIIGREPVAQRLFDGLKRLEYRGYDSAGIATVADGGFERRRAEGKLDNLARVLAGELSPHAGMIEAGFRKRSARNEGEGERV